MPAGTLTPHAGTTCYSERMQARLLIAVSLAAICSAADVPAGRWDGSLIFGTLKVPFTIHFQGSDTSLTAAFINGGQRVTSTSGSFSNGKLQLLFEPPGTRMEATLSDGVLKGNYSKEKGESVPFTASAYCTCSYEGEAGPEIMGSWQVPDAKWRLEVQRKGEDTLATVSRTDGDIGPLTGRFDGAGFSLHYFDGTRAAVLEIEQRKDKTLDLIWQAPGEETRKYKAISAGGSK